MKIQISNEKLFDYCFSDCPFSLILKMYWHESIPFCFLLKKSLLSICTLCPTPADQWICIFSLFFLSVGSWVSLSLLFTLTSSGDHWSALIFVSYFISLFSTLFLIFKLILSFLLLCFTWWGFFPPNATNFPVVVF